MEYSCLKTLAGKHRSKVSKIRAMYKDGTGKWAIPYETKTVIKKMYFANYADCKGKKFTDIVPQTAKNYSHDVTTLEIGR
ncbi:hypothetical protein, partial [Clostridioides difficile]|uniref:hypothetical protein n=1 Tax=Clostridioides difficile TaxID=1496 RepID=UPI003F69F454